MGTRVTIQETGAHNVMCFLEYVHSNLLRVSRVRPCAGKRTVNCEHVCVNVYKCTHARKRVCVNARKPICAHTSSSCAQSCSLFAGICGACALVHRMQPHAYMNGSYMLRCTDTYDFLPFGFARYALPFLRMAFFRFFTKLAAAKQAPR